MPPTKGSRGPPDDCVEPREIMNPSILILALAGISLTTLLMTIFGRANRPWSTLVQSMAAAIFAGMIALDKISQTYNEAASPIPPTQHTLHPRELPLKHRPSLEIAQPHP